MIYERQVYGLKMRSAVQTREPERGQNTTFAGMPAGIGTTPIERLKEPDAVLLDDYGSQRLAEKGGEPVREGFTFQMNERRAKVEPVPKPGVL